MAEKIRPPTHSSLKPQQSPPELRREAEGDLPDLVRVPDPGARLDAGDAINASSAQEGAAPWPEAPPGAFSPVDAVELRRHMNDPNRLGKPRANTTAEQALIEYTEALAAYRADYQGTRSEKLRIPYLEAKQRMIDMGLMKGDV